MKGRLFYTDNLRSFLLLLGIFFHSTIIFSETDGYVLKDLERAYWYDIPTKFIHIFRMPLFFYLAGYFSELVLVQKGIPTFIKHRFWRIFIPTIFGVLAFSPVEYFFQNKLQNPDLSFLEFYIHFFHIEKFQFSYIWFLIYLLIYTFLFILFKVFLQYIPKLYFLNKSNKKDWKEKKNLQNKTNQLYFLKILHFIFFGILFSFSVSLISHTFFLIGFSIFKIDIFSFIGYFSYFLCGVFSFRYSILQIFQLEKNSYLFACVLGVIAFILYLKIDFLDPYWIPYFDAYRKWIRFFHLFLESVLAWLLSYLLLSSFQKWVNFENSFSKYLLKSSLPVFLIHFPVSLVLGYYLVEIKLEQTVKFLVHFAGVTFFSFLIYDVFIKNSYFLNILLGNKGK
ncbi:MAG: acyltransferase family protein [Leptospiraceae bacterium]|nr:acyltransferase family protein [Leptospiraceae bacterium]MCK6381530.1 acyltransferase family protein [Leptospiraceae bacterium]NUM40669.1 acyltransferase family protein [Leptospiraceae bacterium]